MMIHLDGHGGCIEITPAAPLSVADMMAATELAEGQLAESTRAEEVYVAAAPYDKALLLLAVHLRFCALALDRIFTLQSEWDRDLPPTDHPN